jgi:hypothetical protein
MFADAKLVARNSSEEARSEMIATATAVGPRKTTGAIT